MTNYRLCYNERPHREPFWTVERRHTRTEGAFWWKRTVEEYRPMGRFLGGVAFTGLHFEPIIAAHEFPTRTLALAFVEADRRPVVHQCEDVA